MCLRRGYIAQSSGASSGGPVRQNHHPVASLTTAVPVPVRQVGSASHRLLPKFKITRELLASGWLWIGNLITAFKLLSYVLICLPGSFSVLLSLPRCRLLVLVLALVLALALSGPGLALAVRGSGSGFGEPSLWP
jgi:hypothetical protein